MVLGPVIAPGHLVVAGFSMGAETALRLVLDGDRPAVGVIAPAQRTLARRISRATAGAVGVTR